MNNIVELIRNEELIKLDWGVLYPTLAFDLLGQLIVSDNGFQKLSGLPSPIDYLRLTPYEEKGAKYPWGVNYLQLQTYISSVIQELPPLLAENYKRLYPGNMPATIDEIALPFNGKTISNTDENVIKTIQSLDDPSISHEIKESNRRTLNEYGIYEIPMLQHYHSKYHQSSESDIQNSNAIKVVSHGWVRGSKVLIKSHVITTTSSKY